MDVNPSDSDRHAQQYREATADGCGDHEEAILLSYKAVRS